MLKLEVLGDEALIADFREAPGRVTRASVRALNRAVASGRTFMVRAIAGDSGLRAKDVRDALPMGTATFTRPEARLAASLRRIALIKFNARGPQPSRGRGRGVSYRLPGGRGRHPHAFIENMRSGHAGVFVRAGKGRLPIKELFGPSLGHIFRKFRPAGLAQMAEAFKKNFAHEWSFSGTERGGAGPD